MTSLYIHIPFCKQKCNYCDFVSYAGKEHLIDEYVEALCREIRSQPATRDSLASSEVERRLATIYFGGGTPTLLEPRHFDKIIKNLNSSFVIRNSEFTIESNPGTTDLAKLKALRSLGINRLSIGVQSFNDKHLSTLGRIHNASEAIKFYEDARTAGFDNINLDLMFALPGQTLEEWKRDLHTALDLGPEHLSTYNLQIEEGTPLWERMKQPSPDSLKTLTLSQRERVLRAGTFSPWEKVRVLSKSDEGIRFPSEEEELTMYKYTIETLTAAGYKHYEISNFAKAGFECRHNINYWKNGSFIGIGTGAKSQIIPDERNTIFLGLRLLEGLPVENFAGYEKEVAGLINDGLLERNNGHYKLTRQGLYLGNLVFEKFV
ncbi:MAG: radical SAM family heme chaperone HemW [Candidatus Margulisbacteria bacterium]|nr:radical SAM family heme chaperone HemW [Candidatus Margulisiibacteriota bacterium]